MTSATRVGWSTEDALAADVWPPVLAVDPGGTETGVCVRAGAGPSSALVAVTIGRHRHDQERDDDPAGAARYASRVAATSRALVVAAASRIEAEATRRGEPVPIVRVAVEAMVMATGSETQRPRPGRGSGPRVSVAEAADTARAAVVLGAIVAAWPEVLVVPPRGHDQAELLAYPPTLVGSSPAGWPRGASRRSHQRSAWLVAGWAHLAGALVAVDLVELTPPPASDDLDALAEAAARRERARHRTGRADTARTPPQRDLTGWGAAVAAVWTAELDGAPLPADRQATAADAARMVAAARIAWDRVGPPPADPAAPPDVADLAERLLGRHGRAAGWPDATTAQWQAWLRAQLGEGVQRG